MGPRGDGEGEIVGMTWTKDVLPKKSRKGEPKKGFLLLLLLFRNHQKSSLFFEAVKGCQVNWEVFVWLA